MNRYIAENGLKAIHNCLADAKRRKDPKAIAQLEQDLKDFMTKYAPLVKPE